MRTVPLDTVEHGGASELGFVGATHDLVGERFVVPDVVGADPDGEPESSAHDFHDDLLCAVSLVDLPGCHPGSPCSGPSKPRASPRSGRIVAPGDLCR